MEKEMEERVEQLRKIKATAASGGGADKIARQHERGKLTARERIDRLLDPGSFVEIGGLVGHAIGVPGDGVVTGHGTINGRAVCLYSQDATVLGGTLGPIHMVKTARAVELALEMGVPFIGLNDSPGARIFKMSEEQPTIFAQKKDQIFYPNTQASGVVPQISAILGSCAGISVYSPALTDFIFMVDKLSHMFITGPRVIKPVMGEDITPEDLGGARVHCKISGVADLRTKSEEECFEKIKKLLTFLPSNNREPPPVVQTNDAPDRLDDTIADIVPSNPSKPYDMHQIIKRLVDAGDFFEIKPEFAGEILVGFARMNGHSVGFVANQPMVRAGALTVDSSDKQARFMRFCDAFNIPIVLLVDTPAYAPGSAQEHAGIIRHGAKVLYALCESVVPRICVLIRKCYGGGLLGMGVHPGLGTDVVYAWPSTQGLGAMGAKETIELFYTDEYKKAPNPEETKEQLIKRHREMHGTPFAMASNGPYLDDVIEPRDTRRLLISSLRLLRGKQAVGKYPKKHGNMPL